MAALSIRCSVRRCLFDCGGGPFGDVRRNVHHRVRAHSDAPVSEQTGDAIRGVPAAG
ncbi:hypothetical protein GCM10007304_48380 [Rhodococcoides trifolii]|jgi:hypothetical protein|uniref:Uncharacterized protein n=1 Tax=Rhodococcoides trifolii TaxID=908250 RepID=A0A917G8R1_9NOCA|nr:hypothetical protein GCM10007304_48380 [Rhodococcus trifolii]